METGEREKGQELLKKHFSTYTHIIKGNTVKMSVKKKHGPTWCRNNLSVLGFRLLQTVTALSKLFVLKK